MPEASHPNPPTPGQQPAQRLDGRGAGAAWLILKVASAVTALEPGQVLEVVGSDPKLMSDLPPVLARHGCRLLDTAPGQDEYRFLVARERPPRPQGSSTNSTPDTPCAPGANHCPK